jgi:tRNA-specific 2-thiouridylase
MRMNKKRVVVAMSGGVDSSFAAFLLKEEGYEVIGVTMQIWPRNGGCCGIDAIEDAKRVAAMLNIPHYTLNFREVFAKRVIHNFCEEYRNGRTPNPCIRCNQHIKFDALLKVARGLGAYVATGHYARIEYNNKRGRYLLRKGVDAKKDQSYVLYTMTQDQLSSTLMPLGNLTKDEVREVAKELGMRVADKPESQEICFIPDGDLGRFFRDYLPEAMKPGPIVDKEGKVLGKHKGIIFYTIGQRRGLGISSKEPLYVIRIERDKNTVVVGTREDLRGDELIAADVNYVAEVIDHPVKVRAKIRYTHQEAEAVVTPRGSGKVHVRFKEPQYAITPGQAVVFYEYEEEDILLGGGTIEMVCGV